MKPPQSHKERVAELPNVHFDFWVSQPYMAVLNLDLLSDGRSARILIKKKGFRAELLDKAV